MQWRLGQDIFGHLQHDYAGLYSFIKKFLYRQYIAKIQQALGTFIIYLGIQIYHTNRDGTLQELMNFNLETAGLVVVVFGSLIAAKAIGGLVTVFLKSATLVNVYAVMVIIALVGQIATIYHRYKYQDEYQEKFGEGVQHAINDTFNANNRYKVWIEKIGVLKIK